MCAPTFASSDWFTRVFVIGTSQTWCNMPRKFMPVKAKQRQNVGGTNWLINTLTAKGSCFYRYFHILQCKKLTDFFNPSISNQMPLIIISVDNSDVAEGSKGGERPLIIILNNSINKITPEGTRNFPLWLSDSLSENP